MSALDGLALLVVGSLWGRYALRCRAWLIHRRWIIYPTVPLWWALYFGLLTSSGPSYQGLLLGLTHHALLPRVLPNPEQLDLHHPYAYLDAYERFRQSRRLIFGAHLLVYGVCWGLSWFLEGPTIPCWPYLVQGVLVGLAALTDHKGYVLLLGLLVLGVWCWC